MSGGGSAGNSGWNSGSSKHKILTVEPNYIIVKLGGTTTGSSTYHHTITGHGSPSWYNPNQGGEAHHPWQPINQTWGASGEDFTENTSGAKTSAAAATHDSTLIKEFRFYIGDDGDYSGTYGLGEVTIDNHYNNHVADEILLAVRNPSPHYRGLAYCAIEEMQLADFGNQIPQCAFTVQAIPRENELTSSNAPQTPDYATVGQVVDSILIGRGFKKEEGVGGNYTSGDYFNTDELQTVNTKNRCRGFTAKGAKTSQQLLNSLVLKYDFLINEREGVLVFSYRTGTTTKTILPTSLGAFADPEGKDNIPLFTLSDKESSDISNEININYYDVNDNYEKGSQKARHPVAGINRVKQLEIPMGLTAGEAQTVANRVLYKAHEQRQRCKFIIPPSFIDIEAGDLISVTAGTNEFETYNVRVLELNRGADYTHEILGLIEGSGTSDYTGDADEDQVVDVPYVPPTMKTLVIDSPALHEAGLNSPGHYILSCTELEDQQFSSAVIWRKMGESGAWGEIQVYTEEGMLVTIDSIIPDGPIGVWDESAEITITILGPVSTNSPSTLPELDILNGDNLLFVNDEFICFKTVESLGDRQFKLSNLIQGKHLHEKVSQAEHFVGLMGTNVLTSPTCTCFR